MHDHYKVISLTRLSQSARKFGYSEFRSKLSVPQTVSVQEQKFSLTPPKRQIDLYLIIR